MVLQTTLKVCNRTPKKPIKKLPETIDITSTTTVQDIKNLLSKKSGGRDPERFGLYDPVNKKLLKDRRAQINCHQEVISSGEILVKDLGPQLSWTTVFIIEYFGPILFHIVLPLLRPYIYPWYGSSIPPMSSSQYLAMVMIIVHFLKREYETMFVHRFSLSTMPFRNIFKNSAHYWILSGVHLGYWIYAPTSYTQVESKTINYLNIAGVLLYIYGEVSNYVTHQILSSLRSKGGTERGIPQGYGFGLVTCPNYLFELIAWIGIFLVTRSLATAIFFVVAIVQMYLWAIKKEKALRREFPDRYKKKKYVIFPSPTAAVKYMFS